MGGSEHPWNWKNNNEKTQVIFWERKNTTQKLDSIFSRIFGFLAYFGLHPSKPFWVVRCSIKGHQFCGHFNQPSKLLPFCLLNPNKSKRKCLRDLSLSSWLLWCSSWLLSLKLNIPIIPTVITTVITNNPTASITITSLRDLLTRMGTAWAEIPGNAVSFEQFYFPKMAKLLRWWLYPSYFYNSLLQYQWSLRTFFNCFF